MIVEETALNETDLEDKVEETQIEDDSDDRTVVEYDDDNFHDEENDELSESVLLGKDQVLEKVLDEKLEKKGAKE